MRHGWLPQAGRDTPGHFRTLSRELAGAHPHHIRNKQPPAWVAKADAPMAPAMLSAEVNGVSFRFAGSVAGDFPLEPLTVVGQVEASPIGVEWEDSVCYLVVDHRGLCRGDGPTRVELWEPVSPAEVALGCLFLLGDASPGQAGARLPVSPGRLAQLIRDQGAA